MINEEQAERLIHVLDSMGMNKYNSSAGPAALEKIAMELTEIKEALVRIADSLDNRPQSHDVI